MLRLAIALSFIANAATALCSGDSFMDRVTDAERAQIEAAVAETPYPRGLVWTATKGDTVLTLVGTMHIYDQRLDGIFNALRDDIATADLLMVEATPDEEAAMQAAFAADPNMLFAPDGPTLPERLDATTWDAISDAMRARGVPPFLAAKMKPWYVTLTLSIPPCAMPDMIAGKRGLDHLIMGAATRAGIPMQALEPWETLIDMLRDGSEEEQLEMLKLATLSPAIQSEMFVAMLDSYFAGEIAEVWEASRLSGNYIPGLDPAAGAALFDATEKVLLIDRNHRWIPVIEGAAAKHDSIVVAAGAAHLPGDDGVLRLLENAGWDITPR